MEGNSRALWLRLTWFRSAFTLGYLDLRFWLTGDVCNWRREGDFRRVDREKRQKTHSDDLATLMVPDAAVQAAG